MFNIFDLNILGNTNDMSNCLVNTTTLGTYVRITSILWGVKYITLQFVMFNQFYERISFAN